VRLAGKVQAWYTPLSAVIGFLTHYKHAEAVCPPMWMVVWQKGGELTSISRRVSPRGEKMELGPTVLTLLGTQKLHLPRNAPPHWMASLVFHDAGEVGLSPTTLAVSRTTHRYLSREGQSNSHAPAGIHFTKRRTLTLQSLPQGISSRPKKRHPRGDAAGCVHLDQLHLLGYARS